MRTDYHTVGDELFINSLEDNLQAILDGKLRLFNTVSNKDIEITKDNVNECKEMIIEQYNGHGIGHLILKDNRYK